MLSRLVLSVFAVLPLLAQEPGILTPPPVPAPHINGPKLYGVRPGKPFLYRIPCTGERPIRFSARGLPSGLKLDPAAGIVTGTAPRRPGRYEITFDARNPRGKDSRKFTLVVGDALALTPPMGWNTWYTFYANISDQLVRRAADAMVSSGMADFGYQYVSMDDCWMVRPDSKDPEIGGEPRDASGAIRSNRRFPDMKALTAYIHSKGLKAGIYTSPGPLTCAKYEGALNHEEQDARQFAAWGFDLLKYDWCSYSKVARDQSLESRQAPYRKMGGILQGLDRDIVLNLCQYGMNDVWKWGGEVGGQSWRTTGDLGLEKDSRLPGFYSIAFSNMKHFEYAGPSRWNDPDYILIGVIGNARSIKDPPQPTKLTPNEQYSYMSLWALMAAPLFYSGDITRLDPFTLNVLSNHEVIGVNQDALGRQAKPIRHTEDELVMVKELEDGSRAVGLFNLSETPRTMALRWQDLGVSGVHKVRDLWRQKDTGSVEEEYRATVGRHGVVLLRVGK